jgi:hypothetical protein
MGREIISLGRPRFGFGISNNLGNKLFSAFEYRDEFSGLNRRYSRRNTGIDECKAPAVATNGLHVFFPDVWSLLLGIAKVILDARFACGHVDLSTTILYGLRHAILKRLLRILSIIELYLSHTQTFVE